jgi:CheY-like chemotaxis protein
MDLQMPEMDGYEATQYIRKELGITIPIVAMTADAISGESDKCIDVGMNGYISKPFDAIELYHKILDFTKTKN